VSDDIVAEHIQAKKLVEEILQEDERARNQDLWLILQVWQKKQLIKCYVPFDKLGEMITPETITRVRRKIQNDEGKLLPTDAKVLVRRKVNEQLIRNFYSETSSVWKEYLHHQYGVK
jgi:hypothetical protein